MASAVRPVRYQVGVGARGSVCRHGKAALIPSSSGQAFGHRQSGRSAPALLRLNPFFVRASVRSGARAPGRGTVCRLNPFFVRASVRSGRRCATVPSCRVLIPSSSGQAFGPLYERERFAFRRLNPFFVRASVRSETRRHGCRAGQVLIPSSSGQAFGLRSGENGHQLPRLNPFFVRASVRSSLCEHCRDLIPEVLIPSSSGQAFGPSALVIGDGQAFGLDAGCSSGTGTRVLIPSSSGQAFGLFAAWLIGVACGGLNPFVVRASVRSFENPRMSTTHRQS